ncbi:MAG: hypothetical protein KDA46_08320 [Parvularculaceae bacterium]|nr:hypothetical protein [Parvularculaceae bacterium]
MAISVCIIAGNNAGRLARTLSLLHAAAKGRHMTGCLIAPHLSPAALSFARAYVAADARFSLHELALSDGAHALNSYVHHYAPPANYHVVIDADIEPCEGAIAELCDTLARQPDAYGATALSASGRTRKAWAERTILYQGLNRQMFALSRECVLRLRAQQIYLPLGLEGVDGLIAYLLLTDLAGGPQADAHHRLAVADGAFFVFEETPLSPKGAAILASRLTRRARRRIQNEILYCLLKREGVGAMPVTAVELHRLAKKRRLEPRRDPVNWWFDRIVLDEIAAS